MTDQEPHALVLGRWQPPHDGHFALVLEALNRVGRVCIAVREPLLDEKNPFTFEEISQRWHDKLTAAGVVDKVCVVRLPNITNVFYGRDVGYNIEKLELGAELEKISATQIRSDHRKMRQNPA